MGVLGLVRVFVFVRVRRVRMYVCMVDCGFRVDDFVVGR